MQEESRGSNKKIENTCCLRQLKAMKCGKMQQSLNQVTRDEMMTMDLVTVVSDWMRWVEDSKSTGE